MASWEPDCVEEGLAGWLELCEQLLVRVEEGVALGVPDGLADCVCDGLAVCVPLAVAAWELVPDDVSDGAWLTDCACVLDVDWVALGVAEPDGVWVLLGVCVGEVDGAWEPLEVCEPLNVAEPVTVGDPVRDRV